MTVAAFRNVDEEEGAAKAAAGINTVLLLIASAFSAALAGVLVNLGWPSLLTSAHYLLITFAVVAAVGVLPARAAGRRVNAAAA